MILLATFFLSINSRTGSILIIDLIGRRIDCIERNVELVDEFGRHKLTRLSFGKWIEKFKEKMLECF